MEKNQLKVLVSAAILMAVLIYFFGFINTATVLLYAALALFVIVVIRILIAALTELITGKRVR